MLLLDWREFAVDCRRGELEISGRRIFGEEVANTGEGTGLVTWDGSILLAKCLEFAFGEDLKGARVLELGCGTGVVGLSCAALGAKQVILTDLAYVLENIEKNLALNRSWISEEGAQIAVLKLDWTEKDLDKRVLESKVSFIVAADVVWVPELIEPFVATLRKVVDSNKESLRRILISHQTRALRTDQLFFDNLKKYGFPSWRTLSIEQLHPEFVSKRIKILEIGFDSEYVTHGTVEEGGEGVGPIDDSSEGKSNTVEEYQGDDLFMEKRC